MRRCCLVANGVLLLCSHCTIPGVIGGASPRVSQVVPVTQARNIDVCDGGLIQAPEWNGRCGGIIAVQAYGKSLFDSVLLLLLPN